MPTVRKELHELILADAYDLRAMRYQPIAGHPGSFSGRSQPLRSFEDEWPDWAERSAWPAPGLRIVRDEGHLPRYTCYRPPLDVGNPRQKAVWFLAKPFEHYVASYERQKSAAREARAIGSGMRRPKAAAGETKRRPSL